MKFKKILSAALAVSMFTAPVFAEESDGVNWHKHLITATGIGYAPEGTTLPVQAKALAESAAIAMAYKNLAMQVEGVQVSGEMTVKGVMVTSDEVKLKVNSVVKGAKKISSEPTSDGGVKVTLQMPIFGSSNSLAGIIFNKQQEKTPFPEPEPSIAPTKPIYTASTPIQERIQIVVNGNSTLVTIQKMSPPVVSNILDYQTKIFFTPEVMVEPLSRIAISSLPKVNQPTPQAPTPQAPTPQAPTAPTSLIPSTSQTPPTENVTPQKVDNKKPVQKKYEGKNLSSDAEIIGNYTGIIIDCRGLDLHSVMSPVIKNENNETIYGDKNLDYDKIVELGMAAYSDGETNLERAGKNPIVVKAVALDNFNSNPVLSVADSNRVLLENKSTKFLDNLNVVFLQ